MTGESVPAPFIRWLFGRQRIRQRMAARTFGSCSTDLLPKNETQFRSWVASTNRGGKGFLRRSGTRSQEEYQVLRAGAKLRPSSTAVTAGRRTARP